MAGADIDTFIRDQKSKLARHRQQLRSVSPPPPASQRLRQTRSEQNISRKENIPPPGHLPPQYDSAIDNNQEEVPLVARMVEGELQKHRFKEKERQELSTETAAIKGMRNQRDIEGGAALPLRRAGDSDRERSKSFQRNAEYNEYLREEQEKFKNRFANKKPAQNQGHRSRRNEFVSSRRDPPLPVQSRIPDRQQPPPRRHQRPQLRPAEQYERPLKEEYTEQIQGPSRGRKTVDELERQVEELRGRRQPQDDELEYDGGYEPSFHNSAPVIVSKARPAPPVAGVRNIKPPWAQHEVVEDIERVLPVRDRSVDETRKREERNREYNDFLRYKDAEEQATAAEKRGGYVSPVYDNLITGDRDYRRRDDLDNYPNRLYVPGRPIPKSHFSGKMDEAERKLQDIEAQFDQAKVELFSRRGNKSYKGTTPRDRFSDILDDEKFRGLEAVDTIDNPITGKGRKRDIRFGRRTVNEYDEELGLPLGGDATEAERNRRKKEVYAQDLRRQMEEQKAMRNKEKELDRSDGSNNLNRSKSANDILTGYAGGPAETELLSNVKISGSKTYNTPADDAYFYYANKNPLEEIDDEGGVMNNLGISNTSGGLRSISQPGGEISRRVRFNETNEGMIFASDDERKIRIKQQQSSYQQELQRQMDETRRQRELRKREEDAYDRKKDEEIANYNPYGRGGGGAPMKDSEGNIITDLKKLHQTANTPRTGGVGASSDISYSKAPDHYHNGHVHHVSRPDLSINLSNSYNRHYTPRASSRADASSKTPRQTNALGETTHALGGHGIFGQALSNEQKTQMDRYKDDLRLQIEERKREAEIQKQKQKELEEKEQARIDEQQRRMQAEYEEELRRKREKEEEARRANDEVRKHAEERRKEIENKRKAEEEARLENLRQEQNMQANNQKNNDRNMKSPPIPTHTNEGEYIPQSSNSPPQSYRRPPSVRRTASPPTTSTRRPSGGGSHVLGQLASMRRQLDVERAKVESALTRQRHQVEVHDPRLNPPNEIVVHGVQEPSQADIDVFELVRRKAPAPVRRAPSRADAESADALQEFRKLKQQHYRNAHPERYRDDETPVDVDNLEQQQEELLKEQYAENSPYAQHMPGMKPRDLGLHRPTTRDSSQLVSDTAFLGVNGATFEDEDDYDRGRNGVGSVNVANYDTLRSRMHERSDSDNGVDVDDLARKNEERLRKLQRMQSDTVSLNDPEEVLHRFMDRQSVQKERPPSRGVIFNNNINTRGDSRHTLVDDSWLDPSR